jgi:riboflavin synthase
MFTGIVEAVGIIESIRESGGNRTFIVSSAISDELHADQSLAHNGVCLTVEESGKNGRHRVTAISETLSKTMLGSALPGQRLNLERSLRADARIDGHFVQGHVDACGIVERIVLLEGSREIQIQVPGEFETLIVAQGSICVNGISLTVARTDEYNHIFTVCIIPYTMEVTNLADLREKDRVNLEFDILGKYIQKLAGHVRQG